jgi:hypothetical protein
MEQQKTSRKSEFIKAAIFAVIGYFLQAIPYPYVQLAGMLLVGWAIWLGFRALRGPRAPKGVSPEVRKAIEPLKYKSVFKSCAIGIDPDNKLLHLSQNGHYKVYSFSDIRTWGSNIEAGGTYITGGLAAVAANVSIQRQNAANTGFFIEVRDIDFPKWKIDFGGGDLKATHARWMEIFRQYVNES